jgi:hypothetical protein
VVELESAPQASDFQAVVHPIPQVPELVVAAAEVRALLGKLEAARLAATEAQAVQVTSLAQCSSMAVAAVAAEPPPVLVNMVGATVRRQALETMVWTTLAVAQVHQQLAAVLPKVAMALSLFATHPLLWIQRRQH